MGGRVHLLAVLYLAELALGICCRCTDLALIDVLALGDVHGWLLALGEEGLADRLLCLSFILVVHDLFEFIPERAWKGCGLLFHLALKSADRKLEQFILSLRLEHLLVQEVPLLLEIIGFTLQLLYFLYLIVFLFLHFNLIISDALDGFLQIIDLLILHRVVTVLFVQLGDQLSQLELFTLNEYVVALEVLVFLLGEDHVKVLIKFSDLVIDQLLALHHLGRDIEGTHAGCTGRIAAAVFSGTTGSFFGF